jgi:hypothetical protein
MSANEHNKAEQTLDLKIIEINLGTLTTNAESVRDFVKTKLEGYSIERYSGDRIKEAKNDKAELNAAATRLNAARLEYKRTWLKPFEPVEATIDETVKLIKAASAKIDQVVKDVEQGEKDEKRRLIELYWKEQGCELFRLDQIFDERWLNKTSKLMTIQAEISERIEKVNADLAILDKLGEPEAKVFYLNVLDLNRAIAEADRIKANRARLEKIEADRLATESKPEPVPEFVVEPEPEPEPEPIPEPEPEEAPDPKPLLAYELRISGTKEALIALLAYMDEHEIGHVKIGGRA